MNKKSLRLLIIIVLLVTCPVWVPVLIFGLFLVGLFYALSWLIPFFLIIISAISIIVGIFCIPGGFIAMFKTGISYGVCEIGIGIALLGIAILLSILTFFVIKTFIFVTKDVLLEGKYFIQKLVSYLRGVSN